MYTLENEQLKVSINPVGAELSSIWSKSNQQEYLWQGDTNIWSSQAPVLFPIIGGLKNGSYIHNNKTYQLPKHGFIRYNKDLGVDQESDTKIVFLLESSEKTLKMYPFEFSFQISFELIRNQIKVTHKIKNTAQEMMFFSVGGHPAFNCPLFTSEKYSDYYITLDGGVGTKSHILTSDGLIDTKSIAVFEDEKIPLTPNLFDNDALIFKNINAQKATLYHKTKGPIVMMSFEDFPDLGIWAKPNAPFVCIEPWLGYADVVDTDQNLRNKEGIQCLAAGKTHKSSYCIAIGS